MNETVKAAPADADDDLFQRSKDDLIAEIRALRRALSDVPPSDTPSSPATGIPHAPAHRPRRRQDVDAEQLLGTLDAIDVGVVLYDPDDRLVYFNRAYQHSKPEELRAHLKPGLLFADWVRLNVEAGLVAAAQGREEEFIRERLAQHQACEGFEEHELGDGKWVETTEYRTQDGGYLVIYRDITAKRAAELAANAAQEQLRVAIEHLPIGFALFDANDLLVLFNEEYRKRYDAIGVKIAPGNKFESLIRSALAHIRDEWGDETYEELVAERIEKHRNPGGSIIRQIPNGKWYMLREHRLPGGNIALTLTDVTGIKRAEGELEEARKRAETANRAKSDFLAHMSHELRTPLNSIIGFSDIMQNEMFGGLGSDRYKTYAASIHESGAHLLRLINDILDVSRIEANELEIDETPVRISDLIEVCHRMIEDKLLRSSITLEIDYNETEVVLSADDRRVRQILLNLLGNALKFTPRDGKIAISTQRAADDALVLSVADTGVGIPADHLERITEPFTQAPQSMFVSQEGSGLGLALVKSLIELHGGALTIDSQVGTGTTVSVSFPPSRVTWPDKP